jgi:hypothetical protein
MVVNYARRLGYKKGGTTNCTNDTNEHEYFALIRVVCGKCTILVAIVERQMNQARQVSVGFASVCATKRGRRSSLNESF